MGGTVLTYLTEGIRACRNDERLEGVRGNSFPDYRKKEQEKQYYS